MLGEHLGGNVSYTLNSIQKIHLVRKNHKLYAEFNNSSNLQEMCDYSDITNSFDFSLIFGADLNSELANFRYFKGKLSNITVTCKYNYTELPLILPAPSRTKYRFKGWYRDSEFKNKVGNGESSYSPTDSITLYAKWVDEENSGEYSAEEYNHNGEYSFEDNDYINTHVYLYTQENIHRNFEMSFNITDFGVSDNNSSLVSATKNVLRVSDNTNELLNLETTGNTDKVVKNIPNTVTNVKLVRINDILYYSFNGRRFLKLNTYSDYTEYSDNPLIFGAEFDSSGAIYREFGGTLSDIHVKFIGDDATIDDYNPASKELEVIYQHNGEYVFDGTNNINTNIGIFDFDNYDKNFEVSFNIVSIDSNNYGQATLVNSKYENEDDEFPGFVYRLDSSKSKLEFTAAKGIGTPNLRNKADVQSVKISKRDMKLYLKVNDEEEVQLYDFSSFTDFFNTKVTIGSSTDANGNIFRPFKGILSDIVVKLEED